MTSRAPDPSRPPRPQRLPLTKVLDPAHDYPLLAAELAHLSPDATATQATEHRRWEYAMALYAIGAWAHARHTTPRTLLDVGGAGSSFLAAVHSAYPGIATTLVDPTVNAPIEAHTPSADTPPFDVVTALSVLEHVDHWKEFLRACVRHLRPGGLLVLTTDYWDCEGPDTAHFHWMRRRIYNRHTLTDVLDVLRDELRCRRFGGCDWYYSGNHVCGSYTFAVTTLVKDA